MKNIESIRIVDNNNTNYFNGLEHPLSLKKFEIEMDTFNNNGLMRDLIHQFVNLESLSFYSHQEVIFHPKLSTFKKLRIFKKKLGEVNAALIDFNYVKTYDASLY